MINYTDIYSGKEKISIIGLGYVGLPIAVAFAKNTKVIGFDTNKNKINLYKNGIDPTNEVGNDAIAKTTVHFTNNPSDLQNARFHIVAVPTPVFDNKIPDLSILESACHLLGQNLVQGSIIVFESTVYPGVTEEICVPILEKTSGLTCGIGFKVGYSPERINPGDKEHRLENIVKIVAGMDKETLDTIAQTYEMVVEAGVYRAASIQVAEAAKVIENSQRDVNIAFVNELSMIFQRMGINTLDVLEAAATKWNFLQFKPGLVGGHCIGVDPYYLTHRAEQYDYHAQIITAGRRINDSMGKYVAENTVKRMIQASITIKGSRVGILGLTFKENCPDIRNTKVVDIINELTEYGVEVFICDPYADINETKIEYGITLIPKNELKNLHCVILAVAHDDYKQLSLSSLSDMYCPGIEIRILSDVKGIKKK
jgi:UDP-N-acetyl-D-galactosamine dehydrogenase